MAGGCGCGCVRVRVWWRRRLAALARGAGEAPPQRVRQVASRCSAPRPPPTPTLAPQVGQQRELEHAGVAPPAARAAAAPRRLAPNTHAQATQARHVAGLSRPSRERARTHSYARVAGLHARDVTSPHSHVARVAGLHARDVTSPHSRAPRVAGLSTRPPSTLTLTEIHMFIVTVI